MSKEEKYSVTESLKRKFVPYAAGAILNSLPSIDGLLPVHRKIILSMMKNGRTHDSSFKKSLGAMGEMFVYYVHGDAPLYGTMVNMANNGMINPLIDGEGQWGDKFSSEGVAAHQRYTDCRLTKYAEYIYKGVELGAVTMKPNYDNTTIEPVIMPSLIPNILTNVSQSIAVGMASKIPSHNMVDVCNAISNYIEKRDNDSLIEDIGCPDLSSGGSIVYDKNVMKTIYNTGRGSFTLLGSYRYNKELNRIEVYEIPYETTVESILKKVEEYSEKGLMKEVKGVRKAIGKDGLRLDITLKKNVNVEDFILKLRKYTPFESKMSVNFTLLDLDWKTPELMSLKDIVEKWLEHRENCIFNESEFELNVKKKKEHLLIGLKFIQSNIDDVISVIRSSKNDKEAMSRLVNDFNLSKDQSEYVAEMKLRNLNKEYIDKRLKELLKLQAEIAKLTDLVNSSSRRKELIKEQLAQVSKEFGKPRLTKIIPIEELEVYSETKTNEPEDYNLKLFITKDLYLKKLPLTSMRGKYTNRLKEDDSFTSEEEMTNLGEVIVFTNQHNIYKKRLSEIEDTKPSELGEYLPSMFNYEKGETPLFAIPMRKEFNQVVVLGFSDGTLAKVDSQAYYTKQNRTVLKNGYADKELIYVSLNSDVEYLKATTEEGYKIVRDMSQFNPKASRTTSGSRFINLNENDRVISYEVVTEEDVEKYLMKSAGRGKKK